MIFFVSFLIQVISAIELEQLDIDAEFSMSDIQDCDSERDFNGLFFCKTRSQNHDKSRPL